MPRKSSNRGPFPGMGLLVLMFLLMTGPLWSWGAPATTEQNGASDDSDVSSAVSAAGSGVSDNLEALSRTEVVYPASQSEQKTTEDPGSTTIVTSTEIKVGGFRTLDDLLNYVRGFFVTNDRDYSYVGLRGFGTLGGYNSRILLLVDGHKINDNLYGQFYSGEDAPVAMDTIDHIEIIRGPASVVYGNSAVFGVINIITKKGKDVQGAVLSAQGGSLGTLGGGGLYGGVTDSGFQWAAQGAAYHSGGNATLYYPEYDDPSTDNGVARHCDLENSQHGFLNLGRGDWDFESAFMHREKTIPTGVYGTDFDDPHTYTDDKDFFADLAFNHGDPETGQWMGRLSLDVADYLGHYVVSGIPNIDRGDGSWGTADLQYVFTPLDRNKVTVGAEFVDNFRQYQNNYDLGGNTWLDDDRQSTQGSFYAQDELKLASGWFLNAGGRYEYFSTTGGQFVPRGALIWTPAQATVLKLVAGAAYRAPDAFELFFNDLGTASNPNPSPSQESNPNLKNETFKTYEFDWEQTFLAHHRFLLSGFRYLGENLILGVPDPADPNVNVYENVGHDSLNGFEVEYQYQNAGGVQGRLSWAYQRARDDNKGGILPFSPQNLGKANLQVPVDARHLTVAGECQYNGASQGSTGFWTGAYTIFNLKFYSPHFLWDRVEANLDFYNLFNKRYAEPVSDNYAPLRSIQQDGLVIWTKLSYKL